MKRVSFTVYRCHFDAIATGEKTAEHREIKPQWVAYFANPPQEAWFLCGRRKMRYEVRGVTITTRVNFHLGARLE